MEDLRILLAYFKGHKKGVIVILIATAIGGRIGSDRFL